MTVPDGVTAIPAGSSSSAPRTGMSPACTGCPTKPIASVSGGKARSVDFWSLSDTYMCPVPPTAMATGSPMPSGSSVSCTDVPSRAKISIDLCP